MKKKVNILSIDFDFFQDTTPEAMRYYYPDGIDLPTELSTIVWGTKYTENYKHHEEIKAVTINKKLFDQIICILNNQNEDIPVMIAQSHVSIYDFIHDIVDETDCSQLYIANLDMHHDIVNDNTELDCGNWLGHIGKDYKEKELVVTWVSREIATECYELLPDELPIEYSLDKFMDINDFDGIFICRSDNWIPPHLDCHFDTLIKECAKKFTNVMAQRSILKPRDISGIIDVEEALFKKYKQLCE